MIYAISEHAKQRYIERIMDKDNKSEILQSAVMNAEKIETDINVMIERGEELYTGKSLSEYNNNDVTVVLCGTWVIILDKKSNKVVTLYKIDLGLDEEFNKSYVQKLLEKFYAERDNVNKVQEKKKKKEITYTDIIKENEAIIANYRKTIKSLEEQNTSYKDTIKELHANEFVKSEEMRKILGTLVGRKVF